MGRGLICIPDNYSQWERHEAEAEAWLQKLPRCGFCDERIQDDYCYEINGEYVCEDCLDTHFLKMVEDIE